MQIEYFQSDFTEGLQNDYIDAVIVFHDNIEWTFPDLIISYRYKFLNGFKANIPTVKYNYFRQSNFVKYIYEQSTFNFTSNANDDLHWGVDAVEAEYVWGGVENILEIL